MAKIACCHNCAYSYWDREHTVECIHAGLMNWPACANHPESLGRMRRMPERGICPNYRPRPETPQGEVKQIPLGDGYYAYVDGADYEWLSRWKWHMQGGYAVRREKKTLIFMHRQIMNPPKGRIVDHKNRNKLDNTRDNLRNCTHAENARNRGKRHGTTSRFIGVGRLRYCDEWYARVRCRGERFCLGRFTDEAEAARARDHKAVEVFGESARLNFPEEWPPERRAQVQAQHHAGDVPRKRKGRKAKKKERPAAKRTTRRPPQRARRASAERRGHKNVRQR
ncbi:MAG: HNH endonuclease [Phycisphaerales bacterium]